MYDDICFFVEVVDCGKFSQAAEKLQMAQSTISRKISALEDELKLHLIKRDSRNLELTEAGQKLYNEFRDISVKTDKMLSQVLINDELFNHILNILLPVGMVNFAFSKVLTTLNQLLPGIKLNLTYYAGTIDLDNYNYDLAIVSRINKKNDQPAKLVYNSKIIIAASPDYLASHGECLSPYDLSNHQMIGNIRVLTSSEGMTSFYREDSGEEQQIKINYQFYLNSFIEAKHLTLSGVTVSGLMEGEIEDELATGKLVRVLPEYHAGYMSYFLVSKFATHDSRYLTVLKLLEDVFMPNSSLPEDN